MTRHLLVTGATSGIGRAVCTAALEHGHQVIGCGRDWSKAPYEHAAFTAHTLDLAALDTLPAKLEQLAATHPDLDGLILCAGSGRFGHLEQLSYPQIRQLIDLDFTAQAFIARAFVAQFKRQGRGDLVFIGSEAALQGSRQGSIYCAAKFALRGFTQALRQECAAAGLRVTLINPGMVRTPFFDALDFAPGPDPAHALSPATVAAAILHCIEAPPTAVFDEINLSPLKHALDFAKRQKPNTP